jgi:hypothetical protein
LRLNGECGLEAIRPVIARLPGDNERYAALR